MKKNMYAIIDTETANGINNPLVYDASVIIFDKKGNEYFRKNWIINEVWNNTELMNSAYYSWKMPLYKNFDVFYTNMFNFVEEFTNVLTEYNVTHLLAYNLPFDIRALNTTGLKYIQGYFINEDIIKLDIMVMTCELIANTKKYRNFCSKNGYITEKGNYQVKAETVYRYLTNDTNFDESHTSMKDCEIEKMIFMKCIKQKKHYSTGLKYNVWKTIQK